ncbi:filamentous hemagglutinin N-terminal domain-containing protein [Pararobbsia silviterrae]|nr:filamentous hemagglutinin N-terminal domain-containing protein [Pararobbsia silviterrae]
MVFASCMHARVANAQATLPITPDKSANPHPVVTTSASGIPVVNITTPVGPKGISNNQLTDYNVGTSGVVIANNGVPAQTQIAGWVQGNPFIGNTPAQRILLQVTGGNVSQLLGPSEIAGQAAPLVVANPAGIACSGCGFVNVPRVTLSTGLPNFDADGSVAGFNVTQGHIDVGTGGLSAQSSPIDLITRAMTINGQIWAQSIHAVAGANEVDLASGRVTPQAGAGAAPQFAIDVHALGGMYGNGAVRLIGTEAGVGVRDTGSINSLTGDIQLSANGDVTIEAPGRMQAAGDVHVSGTNLNSAGQVVAAGALEVTAVQGVTNSGTLAAGSDVSLAAQEIDNAGRIGAGVRLNTAGPAPAPANGNGNGNGNGNVVANPNANGHSDTNDGATANITQPGSLTINATRLTSSGQLHAGTDVRLDVASAALDNGRVDAANALTIHASQALSNRDATLAAGGPLSADRSWSLRARARTASLRCAADRP